MINMPRNVPSFPRCNPLDLYEATGGALHYLFICCQVALLSPYQSMLYTWDDPSKERLLLWNVYNKKSKGFVAEFWKVRVVSSHTLHK
jgi:hypothetical protein